MRRPIVGIIGNSHRIENRFPVQAVGERNLLRDRAVHGRIGDILDDLAIRTAVRTDIAAGPRICVADPQQLIANAQAIRQLPRQKVRIASVPWCTGDPIGSSIVASAA